MYEDYKLTVFGVEDKGILSDLCKDPHETINLWDHDGYTNIKANLIEKLLYEMIRTDRMDQPRICGT